MSIRAYKVCLFGDGGVGKTTLINRYLTGDFEMGTKITIGLDIKSKRVIIGEDMIKLQIWDFAGEDRFRFLLPAYARGSFGGIFMYDLTNRFSLLHLDDWLTIFEQEQEQYDKQIPIIMVGGKSDLFNERAVTKEETLEIARNHNISILFETSAKTGENVDFLFKTLTSEIIKFTEEL